MRYFTKKDLIKVIGVSALGLAAFFSISPLKTAYQRNAARNLITQTRTGISNLEDKARKAENLLSENSFLFRDKDEIVRLKEQVKDTEESIGILSSGALVNGELFADKSYGVVRTNLHNAFGLPKGQTREVPLDIIAREEVDMGRVIDLCQNLRNGRDCVVSNEFYLMARLRTPFRTNMPEVSGDVLDIPLEYLSMIPTINPNLEILLIGMDPELNNSMGVNLVGRQNILINIQEHGKTSEVRQKANDFYDGAMSSYLSSKAKSDALIRYKANQHDGKFFMKDYTKLIAEQKCAINLIKNGDEKLEQLIKFDALLREQRIVEVVGHTSESGTHYDFFNDEFRRHTDFYYTLRTTTPNGVSEKPVHVGRKNGTWRLFGGDYAHPNEKVGWVNEWKPLYDDRVFSGWRKDLNPKIEVEQ